MQNVLAKGQDFGIGSIPVSVHRLSCTEKSCLRGLWLHAGKQPVCRAKEVECIGRNAILESIGYRLMTILLFIRFFRPSSFRSDDDC